MTDQKSIALSTVSQHQTGIIKSIFKDNDYLLKAMRNLFFGFAVSEEEKKVIRETFANAETREIVRKKIYPLFSDTVDLDVGFSADFWLDSEKEILGAHPDAINQRVSSKQQVTEMLAQAISLLENPDGPKVDLSYNPKLTLNDPLQINLLARSLYIRTVGQGLSLIKLIASQPDETPEAKKKRIAKDSTQ